MTTFRSNPFSIFTARAIQFVLALSIASFVFITPGFAGQSFKITVDQARIMRLSAPASTIIVGNPVIADVSIQDNRIVVVMGKSSGSTNMIALDSEGREIANVDLIVHFNRTNSVTLYKGSARASMNCSPVCERTLHVGDGVPEFEKIEKQITKKQGAVKSAAEFSK